jgi:hypothetical protein
VSHATPGPWTCFIGNANGRGLTRIEAAADSPAAGRHIASLTRGRQQEADARLLAAAPELLDMLELLLSVPDSELMPEEEIAFRDAARHLVARVTS